MKLKALGTLILGTLNEAEHSMISQEKIFAQPTQKLSVDIVYVNIDSLRI